MRNGRPITPVHWSVGATLKRLALVLAAVIVVLGPVATTLWLSTPSGYTHHGIDSLGLARALIYDVSNHCLCQGGSTITEQLVKDLYLGGSDRGYNKLVDVAVALKVERVLTKQEIMADYLSEITTGLGRRGVSAAACAYFQAPLPNLTLGQYALLAGVTQAPSLYDPTVDPELAEQRRAQVLALMISENYITPAEALAANAEPVLVTGGQPAC